MHDQQVYWTEQQNVAIVIRLHLPTTSLWLSLLLYQLERAIETRIAIAIDVGIETETEVEVGDMYVCAAATVYLIEMEKEVSSSVAALAAVVVYSVCSYSTSSVEDGLPP